MQNCKLLKQHTNPLFSPVFSSSIHKLLQVVFYSELPIVLSLLSHLPLQSNTSSSFLIIFSYPAFELQNILCLFWFASPSFSISSSCSLALSSPPLFINTRVLAYMLYSLICCYESISVLLGMWTLQNIFSPHPLIVQIGGCLGVNCVPTYNQCMWIFFLHRHWGTKGERYFS